MKLFFFFQNTSFQKATLLFLFGLIMSLVSILESKCQNDIQIFESLKMVPFLLKCLTFVIAVKSRLTPLEGVSRFSSSIFWIFLLIFFLIFFYFKFLFYFFKKNQKIVTCQAVIVSRDSDSDTCQYYATCHFVSLNLVP